MDTQAMAAMSTGFGVLIALFVGLAAMFHRHSQQLDKTLTKLETGLRAEIGKVDTGLRAEMAELRGEIKDLRGEVGELRTDLTDVKVSVARLEGPPPHLLLARG